LGEGTGRCPDRAGEGEIEGVGPVRDGPVRDGEGVGPERDGEGAGEAGAGAGERDGTGLGAVVGDVAGAWRTGCPPG
jgi:hypothetical protein